MPEPRFAPGDRVRARSVDPAHHTRVPRYARGHVGEGGDVPGTWPLAADRAQGRPAGRGGRGGDVEGTCPPAAARGRGTAEPRIEPVYPVRFPAGDLFGPRLGD